MIRESKVKLIVRARCPHNAIGEEIPVGRNAYLYEEKIVRGGRHITMTYAGKPFLLWYRLQDAETGDIYDAPAALWEIIGIGEVPSEPRRDRDRRATTSVYRLQA